MSVTSKFERQLGFRHLGFSTKIPDVGKSLKPFDYIVGIPVKREGKKILRFVAIEAKTARGWTLNINTILEHQWNALDLVESLAEYSSWLAIGFLDIPKMKRDHNRSPIDDRRKAEAYLLWWEDAKYIMGETSISYGDIIEFYPNSAMEWRKVNGYRRWIVPPQHPIFDRI